MDELNRLIDEYAAAEAAYTEARENKTLFAGDGYSALGHTPTHIKLIVSELARAKDALCQHVLNHRDELRIS